MKYDSFVFHWLKNVFSTCREMLLMNLFIDWLIQHISILRKPTRVTAKQKPYCKTKNLTAKKNKYLTAKQRISRQNKKSHSNKQKISRQYKQNILRKKKKIKSFYSNNSRGKTNKLSTAKTKEISTAAEINKSCAHAW